MVAVTGVRETYVAVHRCPRRVFSPAHSREFRVHEDVASTRTCNTETHPRQKIMPRYQCRIAPSISILALLLCGGLTAEYPVSQTRLLRCRGGGPRAGSGGPGSSGGSSLSHSQYGGCLPSITRLLSLLMEMKLLPRKRDGVGKEVLHTTIEHTASLPVSLEAHLAAGVGAGELRASSSVMPHIPPPSQPAVQQRLQARRSGSGLLVAGDNLKPEVMHGYAEGYAALQWNADGTHAKGIVPLQYSSSHSSNEDETSTSSESSTTSLDTVEKPPAPLRRWTRRQIRGDKHAEKVRESWEQEGFTTYVPISPCLDDEDKNDSQEDFEEVAKQWRSKIDNRNRLFRAELRGIAGVCRSRGRREAMEDAFSCHPPSGRAHPSVLGGGWTTFGVYDGHGGDRASSYCREHLLPTVASFAARPEQAGAVTPDDMSEAMRVGFLKTDQHFVADAERNEWMDGTTCLAVAVSDNCVVVANAGDSRAVMGVVRPGTVEGEEVVQAVPLSRDHKPRDREERERIEAAGGIVVQRKGIARVMGVLAVARAVGDAQLKPYVTAEPEVKIFQRAAETWFIILATDGLWDVMSNREAVEIVLERMLDETSSFKGARRLCHEAYKRGSADNTCVLVIDLTTSSWDYSDDIGSASED